MATVLSSNSSNSAGADNKNPGQGGLTPLTPIPFTPPDDPTPFPPPAHKYPPAKPITPTPPPGYNEGGDSYPGPPAPPPVPDSLFEEIRQWLIKPLNSGIVLISLILLLFLM